MCLRSTHLLLAFALALSAILAGLAVLDVAFTPWIVAAIGGAAALLALGWQQLWLAVQTARWNAGLRVR